MAHLGVDGRARGWQSGLAHEGKGEGPGPARGIDRISDVAGDLRCRDVVELGVENILLGEGQPDVQQQGDVASAQGSCVARRSAERLELYPTVTANARSTST